MNKTLVWASAWAPMLSMAAIAQPYDLSARPLPAGTTISTEQAMTATDGQMQLDMAGNVMEGTMSMNFEAGADLTVLASDAERVTQLEAAVTESSESQTINFMGQLQENQEGGTLIGQTIVLTYDAEEDSFEFENDEAAPLTGAVAEEAADFELFVLNDSFMPEGPVAVGDSWQVDAENLSGITDNDTEEVEGGATVTLESVDNGIALLQVEMLLTGDLGDPMWEQMTLTMELSGPLRRDIESGVNLSAEFTGELRMNANATNPQDGSEMTMTMNAPMSLQMQAEVD